MKSFHAMFLRIPFVHGVTKKRGIMKVFHATFFAFLLVLAIGIGRSANATLVTYEIEGVISGYSVHGLPDFGIAVNDTFSGKLFFDLSSPDLSSSTPYSGMYSTESLSIVFSLTVKGQEFSVAGDDASPMIHVQDGTIVGGGDGITIGNPIPPGVVTDLIDPWGLAERGAFFLYLRDSSGTAISSDSLPTHLDIADWSYNSIKIYGDSWPGWTPLDHYSLEAEITSIKKVPEFGNTGMLLALALIPLVVLRITMRLKFR